MNRLSLALFALVFIAATSACSSTSTWQLCSDHLTPINAPDAKSGHKQ